MLDHLTLGVKDMDAAKTFYDAVLGTLGYQCLAEEHDEDGRLGAAGYGLKDVFFWVCRPLDESTPASPCNGSHLAFKAKNEQQVHTFHEAGLENGGTCDGPPGPRPEYGPNYYAAFLKDPEGHQIEIVYRK